MITREQFLACFPGHAHPQEWADAINEICLKYGINTTPRLVAFLAQCGHECIGFTKIIENLNYSAEALTRTWPRRFPHDVAAQYARQPERVGNRAYADRMGNGPESSGDGFRYRGRGCIQLTGKDNYAAFAKHVGLALEDVTKYLETRPGALESACYYWQTRNLNPLADAGDMVTLTKRINGGTLGLADRLELFKRIGKVFA